MNTRRLTSGKKSTQQNEAKKTESSSLTKSNNLPILNKDVITSCREDVQKTLLAKMRVETEAYMQSGLAAYESQMNDAKLQEKKRKIAHKKEKALHKEDASPVTLHLWPNMMKTTSDEYVYTGNNTGGVKQILSGFSKSSERTLKKKCCQLHFDGLAPLWVTVTYPGIYTKQPEIWKRDKEAFIKRLERSFSAAVGIVWRLEFQPRRGAPHFHMLLLLKENICTCGGEKKMVKNKRTGEMEWKTVHRLSCGIHQFRKAISVMWADVVRDGCVNHAGYDADEYEVHYQNHIKAGCNVETLDGHEMVMKYISKYMSKDDTTNAPDKFGRSWGIRNLNGYKLDFTEEAKEITYAQAVQLNRLNSNLVKSRGNRHFEKYIKRHENYSILSHGTESKSGTLNRMLGAVETGLFKAHISPCKNDNPASPAVLGYAPDYFGMTFAERIAHGYVPTNREKLAENMVVTTPDGPGRISRIGYSENLQLHYVNVVLDTLVEGSRFGMYEYYQVKPVVQSTLGMEVKDSRHEYKTKWTKK